MDMPNLISWAWGGVDVLNPCQHLWLHMSLSTLYAHWKFDFEHRDARGGDRETNTKCNVLERERGGNRDREIESQV